MRLVTTYYLLLACTKLVSCAAETSILKTKSSKESRISQATAKRELKSGKKHKKKTDNKYSAREPVETRIDNTNSDSDRSRSRSNDDRNRNDNNRNNDPNDHDDENKESEHDNNDEHLAESSNDTANETSEAEIEKNSMRSDTDGNKDAIAEISTVGDDNGGSSSFNYDGMNRCRSRTAQEIQDIIPGVITRNPARCCDYYGSVAVYITHSESSSVTINGFEPFWDEAYQVFEARADVANQCFVMTGYDPNIITTSDALSEMLIAVNRLASNFTEVPAMMTTDPTGSSKLVETIRLISDDPSKALIGVFYAGYDNLVVEALVSQKERIQYIGYVDDRAFGTESAALAQQLLLGTTSQAVPLCLNGRPDLAYVGQRCAAFYTASLANNNPAAFGIPCSAQTPVDDIYNIIMSGTVNLVSPIITIGNTTIAPVNTTVPKPIVNSVLAHVDCCQAATDAVTRAKVSTGLNIVIGCQDADTTGGVIDYVTKQPLDLQVYHASSWVRLAVMKATMKLEDGRSEQNFPNLESLISTDIYSEIVWF